MSRYFGQSKRGRCFSTVTIIIFLLNTVFLSISIQFPDANAGTVNHNNGSLVLNYISDYGRFLTPVNWNGDQTVKDSMFGYIGLVIDQDNYDHTPGAEDIADSYSPFPYGSSDDFNSINPIKMVIDDGTTLKSYASMENQGLGTNDPNDLTIDQTVWTVKGKDWAVLQWRLTNIKTPSSILTNICIGLEVPISQVGGRFGLGGSLNDGGDDIDGYDAGNNLYWAQDTDSGVTLAMASGILSDPFTHYYGEDYHADYDSEFKYFFESDTWLYERIHAPSSTATDGITPGNITTTVGWNGINLNPGESRTVTLAIAMNNSIADVTNAINQARYYYKTEATGFLVSEIRDSGSTTPRIEVYSNGREHTDPVGLLSLSANTGPLTGTWTPAVIPMYGYSYFTPNENIDSQSDTIFLRESGVIVDSFSYGIQGIAPDPLVGESTSRKFDSAIGNYVDEWLRDPTPTWNSQNDVGNIITPPTVVMNQVLYNPFPGDKEEMYVELMRRAGGSFNISGYKIVCNDEYLIPIVPPLDNTNKYFVLTYSDMPAFFDNMDITGDNIYLYDDSDNLLDMVGWNTPHNQGDYMTRVPDAFGTYQGYNDATSQTAGWVFVNSQTLMLTEFQVDAMDSMRVELYNPRGGDKILSTRWSLGVEGGPVSGSWTPANEIIPAGGYAYFDWVSGTNPNLEGDSISLFYQGAVADKVSYGTQGAAPDPLIGESTARYFNVAVGEYNDQWTRETSPTFGSQNTVPPIEITPYIIINELIFNPGIVPNGRYIVIMNINPFLGFDIKDYYIVCDGVYQLSNFGNIYLSPGDKFILKYDDDFPATASLFDNMDPAGDNVYLYHDTGKLLDMVGWNSPHLVGMSAQRNPEGFGTYQGYNDPSSVAAGWVFNTPLDVLITEISDSGSAVAQIEVYNPQYAKIDFGVGFTIENKSGPINGDWGYNPAGPGDYAVFNVTTPGGLDPEGDTISLFQNGFLIEGVSYGQMGIVPDPLPGESVQRFWNGVDYSNDWVRNWTSGSNFGAQNDVPPPILTIPIVINEVLFNPSILDNHYVELYYQDTTSLDISEFKLVCNSEYVIPNGTFLDIDSRLSYLFYDDDNQFFQKMNPLGDNVYLYNKTGSLVDMFGWSSPHTQGKTASRIPEGFGLRNGYEDVSSTSAGWQFNQTPSIQLLKIGPNIERYTIRNTIVTYYLTLENLHDDDDLVDITNSSSPWGFENIIYDDNGIPLNDSNGNGLLDIFIPAGGRIYIIVNVTVPNNIPLGITEVTIISVQSTFNSLFKDNATLTTKMARKEFETVTFPVGSFVIPMDDKQNDVLKAFGFVHALLRNGSTLYRIIEPPNVNIKTSIFPLGSTFEGGPMLIMPSDVNIVNLVYLDFPSVSLDLTAKPFVSDRVDVIIKPTNILIIFGTYGHTQDVLSDMGIPFTMVNTGDVVNDPDMLFDYDLIVDDCPGWSGNIPVDVSSNLQTIAEGGGEIIFTDIALRDLDAVFPGHIPVTPNVAGTWPCQIHLIPEFPGQYYGPPILDIYTMGGGQIMLAPTDPDVRVMVDYGNFGVDYRVLAAYFYYGSNNYGQGIVEGFGYHPGDQPPDARILASIFFGNKFVHLPPQPDLTIINSDIKFIPSSPVDENTMVTINATIYNIGEVNATDVVVRFFDGPPSINNQIGSDQIISIIEGLGGRAFVEINWIANILGSQVIYVVVDPDDSIGEIDETNNIAFRMIEVKGNRPPILYIKAMGDDVILNWTTPYSTEISHYLIYRSISQTEFDFSDIWINTSLDDDNGVKPLRSTWNDTLAAGDTAPREYYYVIRVVFNSGEISQTSRTVGKWTRVFYPDISTFSLPLEPLQNLDAFTLTNDMNADYIKWMDTGSHVWRQHDLGDPIGIDNSNIHVGEGYEVKFSNETIYTFTGMPGAMIIYDDDILFSGFDYADEAKNLTALVEPGGNVTLRWQEPASMGFGDYYEVYYSNTRDGFFGTFLIDYDLACPALGFGNNTTIITGLGVSDPGSRLYFIVVPFNSLGFRGASTYSIGIWTEEYLAGYDTFGIPLKLDNYQTADWFCDNIPDTVGINYFIYNQQRWGWHSKEMPEGAFDPLIKMTYGYQISTSSATKFIFIGV